MLTITYGKIVGTHENGSYIREDETVLMEHSLLAIANYETITGKPYFKEERDLEGTLLYLQCMVVKGTLDIDSLQREDMQKINNYMLSNKTATTVNTLGEDTGSSRRLTSEYLYALMVQYKMDMAYENWNIDRLFMLFQVLGAMNQEPKKMSAEDALEQRRRLNAERQKKLKSKG